MELDQRKVVILTTIIKNYLETGEPVGSRTISKYSGLSLSSATIRNEMSDLEEMGYIMQPHTSAGRIPSDKGYRFYVDQLMEHHQHEIDDVKTEMFEKVDKLETTLKQLVKNLAQDTNYAAVVTEPSIHTNKIKFIQTSIMDARRVLLVIMMQGNIVRTATVMLSGQDELDFNRMLSINMLLNDALDGLSGEEITEGRIGQILARTQHKDTVSAILQTIVSILNIRSGDAQIYTSGATNIFKYPELTESDNASRLINIYDLNVMLTIVFPVIYPFIATETEYFCKCICLLVVTPEFSLLYKCDHFAGLIGLILHIFGADSKQNVVS